jgi:hypothetical protein
MSIGFAPLLLSPVPASAQYNNNNADQKAYQDGYQDGVNDVQRNKPYHTHDDQYHGDRLAAYRQGYQEGYNRSAGYNQNGQGRRDNDGDADDRAYPNATGAYGGYSQNQNDQRAYQNGYNKGVRDAQHNRAMKIDSDDYHGNRLQAYRSGYEQGYRSAAGYNTNRNNGHHHDDDDDR